MTDVRDSKAFWLSLHEQLPEHEVRLGRQTAQAYVRDAKHLVFVAARYKFVAKLLKDCRTAIEIGCGDAFGSAIPAAEVQRLVCTDIDEATLADNRQRMAEFRNIEFAYHDFRERPFAPAADAIFCCDVIEHIFPEEEPVFLRNVAASVHERGIAIVGTPNKAAEQYASEYSKKGHVNVKTWQSLRATMQEHFHNVFSFGMNDEIVHTGYPQMCHYIWALCVGPRRGS